jgi:drug/metabolite transporter (DMT)-like permease
MGQIYILLAIFLWSSLGIVVRLAAVPVHVLTFYALVIAVILQGAFIVTKGYQREIRGVKDLRFPVVLGAISAVNSLTFFYAFTTTTIANAVLTHYTAPVIVAFLAVVFLKERITPVIIVAIILASAGLWMMLDGLSIQGGQASGIAAGLVSGIAYALIVIIARQFGRQYRPILLTFIVNVTIIMLLAPFIREFPVHALWSFLFMGIVHSTAAPVLYYRGLREVSATRTAVLGYLEPVCAILLSMAFLHETPGMNSLFGGGLIVCSGYLTVRAGTREAS